jgi:hypothetical protein
MKIEIRHGAPRHGIEHVEVAYVVLIPNLIEGFFLDRKMRKAEHRWGQGWHWEDNNKPCPTWIQQELNRRDEDVH